MTIDPKDGYVITETDKEFIINNIIKPRSVVSIQHEFVDPEYLYISLELDVSFNPRTSTLTANEIAELVREDVQEYFANTLSTLERTFFFSRLTQTVAESNSAIIGVLAKMRLQRRIVPVLGTSIGSDVSFLTTIQPLSVVSTNFITTLNTVPLECRIVDNGVGGLTLVTPEGVVLQNAGTVDYTTGVVSIQNVVPTAFVGTLADIRLSVTPTELGRNISPATIRVSETASAAITPAPSKNVILILDDSSALVPEALSAGLVVRTTAFIETA